MNPRGLGLKNPLGSARTEPTDNRAEQRIEPTNPWQKPFGNINPQTWKWVRPICAFCRDAMWLCSFSLVSIPCCLMVIDARRYQNHLTTDGVVNQVILMMKPNLATGTWDSKVHNQRDLRKNSRVKLS